MATDEHQPRLNKALCIEQAAKCHALASEAKDPSQQIMLDHIAETWLRIAATLK